MGSQRVGHNWSHLVCKYLHKFFPNTSKKQKTRDQFINWSTDWMQFVSTWQLAFFKAEIHKLILKFIWKYEKLRTAKTILGKKRAKLESSHFPVSKLTIKYNILDSMVLDRHRDQWNRIRSPEIYPYIYGQMTFDKVPRHLTSKE